MARKKSKVNLEPIQKIIQQLPLKTAVASNRTIAVRLRQKILDLVLKGISPIEGAGRFPEYKSVTRNRAAEALVSGLRKDARSRARDFGSKDEDVKALRSAARTAKAGIKLGYPDTVKDEFPSKRRRPVNLLLSGQFLRQLKSFPRRLNLIAVGFFTQYGIKLEQGHRDGVNGQPSRPIIPTEGETFTKVIRADIIKTYTSAVKDYLKRTR